MMEHCSLEPYEQQLFKVFNSFDVENLGSLDKDGLTQLCHKLQLEEQGTELVKCLLKDSSARATFLEFKDGLLTLLGNVQSNKMHDKCVPSEGDNSSPDREVSPKFVYGSKKYGRRSRPKNDDSLEIEDHGEINNYTSKSVSVQRSSSQSEVMNAKKRKPNNKLKRCTSFPGNHEFGLQKLTEQSFVARNNCNNEQEFLCSEEMLRAAWKKLGVGKDGYLNQTELILVCDAIGLHELAKGVIRQLSDKLALDFDHKISFQELLKILQRDDTWSEVLNPPPTNTAEETLNLNLTCVSDDSVFTDSKMIQFITLGPEGSGFINIDVIIDMWENAGITSPKLLLQDLGFLNNQISIVELATVLEKEIKGMNDNRSDFTNPHIALLQAFLTLYQSEIQCLKNILEQVHAEREKLKCDVFDANNRAALLAQEVDDNHARMEKTTQNQVRLLEQRHSDILKDISEQFEGEKEQISLLNKSLEQKIFCLENEESKLRNDLLLAQTYTSKLEKENHHLGGQISELRQVKDILAEQISVLESEKHISSESENDQKQIETLLAKLSALQLENSQLRDRNDEMVAEIESLSNQIAAMRSKVSSTPTFNNLERSMDDNNFSIICEGVGLGAKRRNDDSPSKDIHVLGFGDGSPRLGKVRKYRNKSDILDVPFTSSESGFDTELDCLDSSLSASANDGEEIARLQAKIAFLEQILAQNSISVPAAASSQVETDDSTKIIQLTKHCCELENIFVKVKRRITSVLKDNSNCMCETLKTVREISANLENISLENETSVDDSFEQIDTENGSMLDASTSTEDSELTLKESLAKYASENRELKEKCADLENCIELLRNEYERCEDYWATKLDEERQMFEQEQHQSNETLSILMKKIAEYDEQYSTQDKTDGHLPPIEEKYNLEKQFTDLEAEFDSYRAYAENQIGEKDDEISVLKQKLSELALKQRKSDSAVQVNLNTDANYPNTLEHKINNLSNYIVESTNVFSADMMPFGWNSTQSIYEENSLDITITNNAVSQRDYVNPTFLWNRQEHTKNSNVLLDNVNSQSTQNLFQYQNLCGSSSSLPTNMAQTSQSNVQTHQPYSILNVPCTSTESSSTMTPNNSTPCRPKRTRKYDRNYISSQRIHKRDSQEKESKLRTEIPTIWGNYGGRKTNAGEQNCIVPISTVHNLNKRLHYLEGRCRDLQVVVKKQHYYTEQMLQQSWIQHRGEKTELQILLTKNQEKLEHQIRICSEQLERLARTDMLVKELYVENSYLIANVHRLEQQCHMLSQCNANSSSV